MAPCRARGESDLFRILRIAVLAALLALATGAQAAPKSAAKPSAATPPPALTLVYGDDHVFGVVAPAGWVVDDSSGLGSRIRVVLYPRGQKWSTAKTVMYVNPLHQKGSDPKSLGEMIDRDVASFRRANPRGAVTAAPMIRTLKGQTAQVRYFSPTGGQPAEAVAYIPEENLVMLLVLSSREPGGFRAALPAFQEFVRHYQFVGGDVQTPTAR